MRLEGFSSWKEDMESLEEMVPFSDSKDVALHPVTSRPFPVSRGSLETLFFSQRDSQVYMHKSFHHSSNQRHVSGNTMPDGKCVQ